MATQTLTRPAAAEGMTEFFDGIACLDERVRRQAMAAPLQMPSRPSETGRYIEVQGPDERLLIPLGRGVTHIGRGLAADLHLDENSVSRRHAILVYRSLGFRSIASPSTSRSSASLIAIARAISGGTAFPICRNAEFIDPLKINPSGKLWSRAASLTEIVRACRRRRSECAYRCLSPCARSGSRKAGRVRASAICLETLTDRRAGPSPPSARATPSIRRAILPRRFVAAGFQPRILDCSAVHFGVLLPVLHFLKRG